MSRTETVNPKRRWDLTDAAVLLGLISVVAGIALFSVGAALIVTGLAVTGLAIIWPQRS